HGYPFWASIARRMSGWALTLQGQFKPGIAMIEDELARFSGSDADMVRYQILIYMAEAYQKIGECERAASVLDDWQGSRRTIPIVLHDAFYHRVRGNVLRDSGGAEAAEAEYRKSLSIAGTMNDKCRELQAALDLAPWLAKCGRRAEARAALAEI